MFYLSHGLWLLALNTVTLRAAIYNLVLRSTLRICALSTQLNTNQTPPNNAAKHRQTTRPNTAKQRGQTPGNWHWHNSSSTAMHLCMNSYTDAQRYAEINVKSWVLCSYICFLYVALSIYMYMRYTCIY